MQRFNCAAYRANLIERLEGAFDVEESAAYPDAVILNALTRAEWRIQRAKGFLQETNTTIDLVAETASYAVPTRLLGRSIRGLQWKNGSGDYVPLDRIDYSLAVERGLLDATSVSGDPSQWAWDQSTTGNAILLPTPSETQTDGLLALFSAAPTPLQRIFTSSGATTRPYADVTLGSATVVIQTAADADVDLTTLVVVGDAFGVVGSAGAGSGTTIATLPMRWYTVLTVADGAITLTEAYEGVTDTGVDFVTGQVPDTEKAHPDLVGEYLGDLAFSYLIYKSDPAESVRVRNEALAGIATLRPDEQGRKGAGARTGTTGWSHNPMREGWERR